MDTLTAFPAEFRAGTTLKVRRTYADFAANAGWTAKLTLFGAATITKDATADADAFLFTVLAADTDTELPAGGYGYVVQVTSGAEVYDAESGRIGVARSMTGMATNAGQSQNEKNLTAVTLMIAGKLSAGDMSSYQIAGRALSRYTFDELLKLQAALQVAVNQERNPETAFGGEVLVTFSGTGANQ